ncbi:MAG: hypothetical protein AAF439_09540 [Pseudomonadota bacterium]
MKFENAPFSVGAFSVDPATVLPYAIVAIVLAILLMGLKREYATFAIFAGVIGAILAA